jgi:MFS family permease
MTPLIAIGLAVAVVAGVSLHLVAGIDPVNQMLSDAVVSVPGAVLLGIACAGLVLVAGVLAVRTARHGPRRRLVPALLGLWAAALAAIVVFPTNPPGMPVDTAAVIHRYGAAMLAVVPPVVGLLVARTRRLRTAAWTTAGAAALFGLLHGPAVLLGGGVVPYAGLTERVLFALILVLLAVTAQELRPLPAGSASPGRDRPVTARSIPAATMVPNAPPTIAEVA